jgi:hypothetical protein
MKLIMPSNIFSELLVHSFSAELKETVEYKSSALITSEIKKNNSYLGLIPTMDLLKNHDLYVSKDYGISFESSLCNSYIYFRPDQERIREVSLFGDISSVEIILSRILFKEIYNADIEIEILTSEQKLAGKNSIISGNKNFENDRFLSGISFSEEVIESLSLPFVNYVFASSEEKILKDLNEKLKGISNSVYEKVDDYEFKDFSETAQEYIRRNISSLIVDFASNDIEGINQLLRLPYYHGIINDIIEVKFI